MMLTAKQHRLLVYIEAFVAEHVIPPSFEEMAAGMGMASKSGIHRLLIALEERGFIRRLPGRARAIEIIRSPSDMPGLRVATGNQKFCGCCGQALPIAEAA